MSKRYKQHVKGQPITFFTDGIVIDGYEGTWYVIAEESYRGMTVFLLEDEECGDETYGIVVDEYCNVLCDEVTGDFPECLEYGE